MSKREAKKPRPDAPKTSKGLRDAKAGPLEASFKAEILALARQRAPNEACGFFLRTKAGKVEVVEAENSAVFEPHKNVRVSAEEFERIEEKGEMLRMWHSHVNESAEASPADMAMSESCELPFDIVALPDGIWSHYEPHGYRAPLLGRPFVHGVLDCYSLIRDYYAERLDIKLPDFERPDDWWHKGGNLYIDHFEEAGFRRVSEIQQHDVILMQIGSPVANHAAVYLSDGLMMHHVQDRISMIVPYVIDFGYYSKHTVGLFRHKSLM